MGNPIMGKADDLEEKLLGQIKEARLPLPEREVDGLIPDRKFRFDFAWVGPAVLCEVQGGVWMGRGGHSSGGGIQRDAEKTTLAQLEGYIVVIATAATIKDGRALEWIARALGYEIEDM